MKILSPSATKKLVILPVGGMGNRLRAMAAAHVLARQKGWDLHVGWTANSDCLCGLQDLWEKTSTPPSWPENFCPDGSVSMLEILKQKNLETLFYLMDRHPLVFVRSLNEFRHDKMSLPELQAGMSRQMRQWKIQEQLLQKKLSLPPGTIGLHIRRKDQLRSIYYTPLVFYIRIIRKELKKNPSAHFFVCTDDPGVLDGLRRKFHNTPLIAYHHARYERNSLEGTLEAFLDMITLADCCPIYGSKYSTFPRMAALYGKKSCSLLSTRNAPNDWAQAAILVGSWLRWDAEKGWQARFSSGSKGGLRSRLSALLIRWISGDFYQMGFWHRLKSRHYKAPVDTPAAS